MKIFQITCFIVLIVSISQEKAYSTEVTQRGIYDYLIIFGGFYMNENCSFISESETKKFNSKVKFIVDETKDKHLTTNFIMKLKESSKESAYSDEYSDCNEDAKLIFQQSEYLANQWTDEINKRKE